ncbi:Methionine aminopeptidase 1D, mitochondrial [Bonamia ostreae]|uniref:Methionine aminopeptidase 1D, mitochondrial n=1 Tax=Bonamia ostreae TaxID=126728 RepID=A0ABV2ALS1_9EUKA
MSKFSRKFASTGKILKTRRMIPPRIEKPSYYLNGLVENQIDTIPKYKEALAIRSNNMREAAILAKTMRFLAKFLAKEGTTTEELDYKIHLDCIENGFYPAALHYKNFPKSISTSVNEIACHGIPDDRKLNVLKFIEKNGDILKVDCMSYRNGHFGDCCGSFVIGEGGKDREEKENLVDVARKCVRKAIDVCGPGVPFSQVGNVISFLDFF